MARKALVVKCEKKKEIFAKELSLGKKPTMPTKIYNRCKNCGRSRGYLKKFDMCRICFRELASQGKLAGIKKSSW
jgi:small subunit ribosomal protein S14